MPRGEPRGIGFTGWAGACPQATFRRDSPGYAGLTMRIGYVIPEFPSQTHVWIWREILHTREWGMDLRIFSTSKPGEKDRARHSFAGEAERETTYLWPNPKLQTIGSVAAQALRNPIGFFSCVKLALTMEKTKNRGKVRPLLPLIVPACILASEVRKAGIDRIHSHSVARSAVICMMVKRLTGVPYSLTLNADLSWWGGAVERKIAESDFTIAITQALLDEVREKFRAIPESRTLLGRIGVDTKRWARPIDRPLPADGARRMRIVSVGRMHHNKAFDVLMEASKHLIDKGYELDVRIIGDGGEREKLEAMRRELGLENTVSFLGSMSEDQIIDELLSADVFSAVSRHEPLGVVYMEAMSLGVPTLGTTSGGVGEIIDSGESGLLVEPGDPEELARVIESLLTDAERRRRMGEAGRRAIVEKFDSRIGAATIFEKLTGETAPRDALNDHPPAQKAASA